MQTEQLTYRIHNIGIYLRYLPNGCPPALARTLQRQLKGFEADDMDGIEYRLVVDDYERMSIEGKPYMVAPEYALYRDGLLVIPRERFALRQSGNTLFLWGAQRTPISATFLLQYLMLPQGKTLIHAAGVSVSGKGILFPALGGVGKTALIATLMKRPEVKLLGDDYVLLGKSGEIQAFPAPFTLYRYHRSLFPDFFRSSSLRILPGSFLFRALRRILDTLKVWHVFEPHTPVEYAVVPAHDLYPRTRLEWGSVPVHAVYMLQRVHGLEKMIVRSVDVDEMSAFVGNVLLYEWNPFLKMLIVYLTLSGSAIWKYLHQVQEVIHGGLLHAAHLRVIELPLHLTPEQVGAAVAEVSLTNA